MDIHGGETIGIVGRTGSGKSTLMLCLLRLLSPSPQQESGSEPPKIEIDGIDIDGVPLKKLRSSVTVIPQDPLLFNGTIRYNLDPFNQHPDTALWEVLDQIRLKQFVRDLPKQLGAHVTDGGANISQGQRQLMCFARALLRKSKIILVDEATASVDTDTDTLIQQTMAEAFEDATVLVIAHRLSTVMRSNRILVLDAGEVAEFDTPAVLAQKVDGSLRGLINETGPESASALIELAKLGPKGGRSKAFPSTENIGHNVTASASNAEGATVHHPDSPATEAIANQETMPTGVQTVTVCAYMCCLFILLS